MLTTFYRAPDCRPCLRGGVEPGDDRDKGGDGVKRGLKILVVLAVVTFCIDALITFATRPACGETFVLWYSNPTVAGAGRPMAVCGTGMKNIP